MKLKVFLFLGIITGLFFIYKQSEYQHNQYEYIEKEYLEKQDALDKKPVKTILYIGNSHTFTHNIPLMVNIILLSMNLKHNYSYSAITQGGIGVKHHWQNPKVQKALEEKRDYVIIQPQSSDILKDILGKPMNTPVDFYQFGAVLLRKAKEKSSKVALYQPWIPNLEKQLGILAQYIPVIIAYHDNIKSGSHSKVEHSPALERESYHYKQSLHYTKLAKKNKADVINVGQAWHRAEKDCANVTLLGSDNHHANIQGAYLIALRIARYINDNKVIPKNVFSPQGMTANDKKCFLNVVNSTI